MAVECDVSPAWGCGADDDAFARSEWVVGCGEKISDPVEPGGCTAPLVTPSVSETGSSLVGVGGITTSTSGLGTGGVSLGIDMGAKATCSRSFSWNSPSRRCFSLETRASADLLVPEPWGGGEVSRTSMSWARSLGATQGTSFRTSFEIKEAFLGERCEPPFDLFTSFEGARTGGLLSGTEFVASGCLGDFGLRENLRLELLKVAVEDPVVVFGCVVEVAVRELLSLSFSAWRALSRSSGETKVETVMDGFRVFSLSVSVDEAGVRSCACAAGWAFGAPFSMRVICGGSEGVAMGMGVGMEGDEEEEERCVQVFVRDVHTCKQCGLTSKNYTTFYSSSNPPSNK